MPVAGAGSGRNPANDARRTEPYKPPWVKEGPPPIPMPSQPWTKSKVAHPAPENKQEASSIVTKALRRVSDASSDESGAAAAAAAPVRKTSKITIVPSQPKENGLQRNSKSPEPPRPEPKAPEPARKVSETAQKPPKPTEPTRKAQEPVKKVPEPAKKAPEPTKPVEKVIKIETKAAEKPTAERQSSRPRNLERSKTSDKYEGLPGPPAPPMPPAPPAPPPPPPPPMTKTILPDKQPISEKQAQKLEALRSRPKRRPDWNNMMKEIETGRKLNHIKSNDRSAPLLPKVKAKGQFVYESERPNLHNQLLKQIETGVRLKPTRTNDRSRPFIEGLRKFRRQMTIEEQIQKSASMASMGILEPEPDPLDEVDDIDKVRDDLQSTKQMLALELKNKETLERDNKKLLTRILNLEVELEKERNKVNKGGAGDSNETRKEMQKIKEDAEKAKKNAEEMENKYHEVSDKLDVMKIELDEAVLKSQRLEKQLKVAQAANLAHAGQPIAKQPSAKRIANQNRIQENNLNDRNQTPEESEEETETETESEEEVEGEDEEAQKERRLNRELKLLATKLKSFKDKREAAKKERKALKEQMAKQQKQIKDEKKKYKVLQKEVDKMSKLMNEDEEEEEEEEEEEDEEEEEEESSEEESEESESEESEGDLPESAPPEKRKLNLQTRTKRFENLLSSLKKGNYLLKANVDRYKDELSKQKEMSLQLQEDLNSVLAELG